MMNVGCIAPLALALGLLSPALQASDTGDAARGEELYTSRCIGCHSIDSHRVGPAHRGVFGRRAGSVPGYEYSSALRQSQLIWTEHNLERWLANPEQTIPGQKMGYRVDNAQDRADLIAFLEAITVQPTKTHLSGESFFGRWAACTLVGDGIAVDKTEECKANAKGGSWGF
ncbi:MAG TPA: c-type cytochrome [Gammaproteobacteria bacterium]|jgi:cytochrome c